MTRTILILGIKLCHHPLVLCISKRISTWDWGVDLALTATRTCLLNYLNICLLDAFSQINYPTAEATQPRHTTTSCEVHILLLIHNTKGGWQSVMSMGHCQSSSGHYIGNSSILDPSSQITEPPAVFQTCTSSYLYIILKDGGKVLCLGARYQSTSGHYTGNSSILDPSGQIMEPPAISHPSPRASYTVYILLLIHNTKELWPTFMSLGLISV
jgi:hypothetical protein